VTGRRDDPDAGQRLRVAVDDLQVRARKVVRSGRVRVVRLSGRRELRPLNVDRRAGERGVAAAMVRVKVAVGDRVDVGRAKAHAGKGLIDSDGLGLVALPGRGVERRKAGIEQEQPIRMPHEVADDGDRLARVARALRRDDEAIMEAFDARFCHVKNSQYWPGVLTKGVVKKAPFGVGY
jgi:hypothetical protein